MTKVYLVKISPSGRRVSDKSELRKKAYGLVSKKLSGEIKKHENGKPYIEGSPVFFNISHSASFAAVAFSDGEVGVDIELLRDVDLRIAEKFHADEQRYVFSSEDKRTAFFEVWTAKEAYLKKSGTGITVPLNSFSVIGMKDIHRLSYENLIITVCSEDTPQFCGLLKDED